MTISGVEAKAYLFPPSKGGRAAVVVSVKQGQNLVSKDDPALVPAGIGILQAEGSPVVSGLSSAAGAKNPSGYFSEPYRVRIFTVLDVSDSMNQSSGANFFETKLQHVQSKIQTLAKGLGDLNISDIEHVLVPYDDSANIVLRTRNTSELIDKVLKLNSGERTNFDIALQTVTNDILRDRNNQARNLMVFISDGQHNGGPASKVIASAEKLPNIDCAAYMIGVGPDYDELLMKSILTAAKFGGLTHIPLPDPQLNVFKDILPPFVAEMRMAPYYPIVSFNRSFSNVVNMRPSVRDVIEETYQHSLRQLIPHQIGEMHFPATVGYQLNGYSVGSTTEGDVQHDRAVIYLIVKSDATGNPLLVKRIPIIPIKEAILDPSERKLIERAPIDAQIGLVLGKRDPYLLEQFIKDNAAILNEIQQAKLREELRNLRNPNRTSGDEAASRTVFTQFSTEFAQHSFNPSQVSNLPPGSKELPKLHSGFVGPLDQDASVGSLPRIEGPANVSPTAYDDATPPIRFKLEKIGNGPGVIAQSDFGFQDAEKLTFGRNPEKVSVEISGDHKISREHFEILRDNKAILIRDLNSTYGTHINGEIVLPNNSKELHDNDVIKVGSTTFKFFLS